MPRKKHHPSKDARTQSTGPRLPNYKNHTFAILNMHKNMFFGPYDKDVAYQDTGALHP
jgi:hypothetical protein